MGGRKEIRAGFSGRSQTGILGVGRRAGRIKG